MEVLQLSLRHTASRQPLCGKAALGQSLSFRPLLLARSELRTLESMEMRELYVPRLVPQHLNMKTLPSFLRKVLGDSKGSCLSLRWDCFTQFPRCIPWFKTHYLISRAHYEMGHFVQRAWKIWRWQCHSIQLSVGLFWVWGLQDRKQARPVLLMVQHLRWSFCCGREANVFCMLSAAAGRPMFSPGCHSQEKQLHSHAVMPPGLWEILIHLYPNKNS